MFPVRKPYNLWVSTDAADGDPWSVNKGAATEGGCSTAAPGVSTGSQELKRTSRTRGATTADVMNASASYSTAAGKRSHGSVSSSMFCE